MEAGWKGLIVLGLLKNMKDSVPGKWNEVKGKVKSKTTSTYERYWPQKGQAQTEVKKDSKDKLQKPSKDTIGTYDKKYGADGTGNPGYMLRRPLAVQTVSGWQKAGGRGIGSTEGFCMARRKKERKGNG